MARDRHAWYYGLELAKATKLRSGTLYPALLRLRDNGFLISRQEAIDPAIEGRPPRTYYQLTTTGSRLAEEAEARAQEVAVSMQTGFALPIEPA
jgi:DNA-binding PadR family transcriptional regulator